jgi:outer membrane protein assembly factor BamB
MNCTQARENVELYALDALSQEDRAAMEQHLKSCAACRAEADQVQSGIAELRPSMRADAIDDPRLYRLRRRIHHEIWARRASARLWFFGRAAAAILVVSGLWVAWYAVRHGEGVNACACAPWAQSGMSSNSTDGTACPLVVEKRVFALTEDIDGPHLRAMDRRTGAFLWKTAFPVVGAPSVDSERVYVWIPQGAGGLQLVALDSASGTPVWRSDDEASPRRRGAPQLVVAKGRVGWSQTESVAVLDAHTGRRLWARSVPQEGLLSAAIMDAARLYVASGQALYALDVTDGRVLWRSVHDRPGIALARPIVQSDGNNDIAVALQTSDGRGLLQCHRAGTGASLWTQATEAPLHLLASRDRVYVRGRQIRAYDVRTGGLVWSVLMGGCSPLVLADDRLYVSEGRERKGIFALRAENGQTVWYRQMLNSCSGFVVAGKMGYLCTLDGSLCAVVIGRQGS